MRIILLGAPGSGKGTQALGLAKDYGLPLLTTGEMLRVAVQEGTAFGKRAAQFMNAGALVPDALIVDVVLARLRQADCAPGFLMDGFPRSIGQAEALDRMLQGAGQALAHVIFLDVPEEELLARLRGRGRADDTEATIRERLRVYRTATTPLIAYYEQRGCLRRIPGVGRVEEIATRIRSVIDGLAA